ncbi:MAG: SPFH domain-containing protein [Turicibacter sanguinis]
MATEQGYLSADSKEGSSGDDSFLIPTSDGKTVNIDLEYSYHFDSELLPQTFTKFKGQDGKAIEETFMRGKLKTWVGEVSSKFSVIDIYGDKRTELNANVLEYVKDKFYEYGIVIDSVNVSRIGLDAQTEEAIQLKINEQQELETARLDKEKAEIQAEADAKKIEAQSEANRMISESLTEELLKLEQIQKWSGEVPQVQGASTPIISLD